MAISHEKKIQELPKANYIKAYREDKWEIEIPKINLVAEINDGTDNETLNQYVGHFVQSGYLRGNISLAAHNRGYPVNYFSDIKNLENGDEIIYSFRDVKLKYIVYKNTIIKDTDIEVIENTRENMITLITCVENEPEYRRCVQGKLLI